MGDSNSILVCRMLFQNIFRRIITFKIPDRVQNLQTQCAYTTRYTLKRPKINTLIRLSKTRSVSVTTWLTQWLTKVGQQCPATRATQQR